MLDKIESSIFGFVIGDALGVPYEFYLRETLDRSPIKDMIGFGTHNQPEGTWSDDSSLMFCLIESLCSGYNLQNVIDTYLLWFTKGFWTPHGKIYDVGHTTKQALNDLKYSSNSKGKNGEYNNGNGGLMLILPLIFYLYKEKDINKKFNIITEVTSVTHGHLRSIIASCFYVEFGIQLLMTNNIKDSYYNSVKTVCNFFKNKNGNKELVNYSRLFFNDISSLPRNSIKSTGYVIDTLEAVVWCLMNSHNYVDSVIMAVNLGEDTDTIGALTGGLAGLVYGEESIPDRWLDKIVKKDDILNLIKRFVDSLRIPVKPVTPVW